MGSYIPLFTDPHFRAGLWRCTEPEPVAHAVEVSTTYDVILPYHGSYIREEGGRKAFADRSRILFESPGSEYRIHHPVSGGDRCLVLTLQPDLVDWLGERMEARAGVPRFPATVLACPPELFVLHRRLQELLRADPPPPLEIAEAVYRTVDLATRRTAAPVERRAPRQAERALQHVFELLQHRFCERITLDEIARHAAYSPFHLARLFRATFGMPVHRYLTALRLRSAFQEIIDGAHDLSRLALSHGFSSHSHFTAAFRTEFGFPPSRLRHGLPAPQIFDSPAPPRSALFPSRR